MRYISVCSGIEAATVAWHHMGWTPAWFSEIEKFPSAVLAHHYPEVRNLGDMTQWERWPDEPIDLLVGGTPCQSFSVAGLRKGLHDPRGGLMLTFLEIAQRYRPRWVVWENVPGVLSSNGGRDFGAFLGALGELGYGWAYRVLDAQWFGVAQRRRRVFVVGCLGDQASAAAVLFESESVQRNPAPSREKGQGSARGVARCFAGSSESRVAATLETTSHDYSRADGFNIVAQPVAPALAGTLGNRGLRSHTELDGHGAYIPVSYGIDEEQNASRELFGCLKARTAGGGFEGAVAQPVATFAKTHKPMSATDAEGWSPVDAAPTVTHWPRDRSDAGTDVAVVYERHDQDARVKEVSVAPTLHSKSDNTCDLPMVMQPVAPALTASNDPSRSPQSSEVTQQVTAVHSVTMQVRRLTPTECERLQGFPDGYTNIAWRGKPESPDGPRYKALGNSMAVPCMKWIGERINAIEEKHT